MTQLRSHPSPLAAGSLRLWLSFFSLINLSACAEEAIPSELTNTLPLASPPAADLEPSELSGVKGSAGASSGTKENVCFDDECSKEIAQNTFSGKEGDSKGSIASGGAPARAEPGSCNLLDPGASCGPCPENENVFQTANLRAMIANNNSQFVQVFNDSLAQLPGGGFFIELLGGDETNDLDRSLVLGPVTSFDGIFLKQIGPQVELTSKTAPASTNPSVTLTGLFNEEKSIVADRASGTFSIEMGSFAFEVRELSIDGLLEPNCTEASSLQVTLFIHEDQSAVSLTDDLSLVNALGEKTATIGEESRPNGWLLDLRGPSSRAHFQ